jgi:hypothetical protein
MDGRGISPRSSGLRNKRFTQDADPHKCVKLFNQQVLSRFELLQLLPPLNDMRIHEGF